MTDRFFIGYVACPYYGDETPFMDGRYFPDEATLREVFDNSMVSDHSLTVTEIWPAPAITNIPVRWSLMCKHSDKPENFGFAVDWDDEGQSRGGLYTDVPEDVRDRAIDAARALNPQFEYSWKWRYAVS